MLEPSPNDRVAAHLRAELARHRIPQTQVAERLGLSENAISRRLLGHTPIEINDLYAIAELLDMQAADLLPQNGGSRAGGPAHA